MSREFTEWTQAIISQALKLRALELFEKIEQRDGSEADLYTAQHEFNRAMDKLAKMDSGTPPFRYLP